jgi:hypothetical protein
LQVPLLESAEGPNGGRVFRDPEAATQGVCRITRVAIVVLTAAGALTGCVHYGNFTKPDMSQFDQDRGNPHGRPPVSRSSRLVTRWSTRSTRRW